MSKNTLKYTENESINTVSRKPKDIFKKVNYYFI